MDSQSAKNLVIDTFENGFDKAVFLNFIRNLVKKFDESKAVHFRGHIKDKFKKTTKAIKTYERLGTYTDPEDKTIDILIVYLEKAFSLDYARSTLRNFVAEHLKDRNEKDAALVAFVPPQTDDWRFSLVKMEYQLEKSDMGRLKAKTKLTPAKRFSFLVGKNENSYTAKKQFLPILTNDQPPLLSEFEEAFNVEKVTKEFFAKYRGLFNQLKESLDKLLEQDKKIKQDFTVKKIDTVDFAKKLLGQIVFLYFLQKKGWFGVDRDKDWGTGSKKFLRELFEGNHGPYKNFFNDVLEPLFYEALRNDRSYDKHYFSLFKCKIPFLNGGLFDPINDYDWTEMDILLSNTLFSNNNPTKEGDTGDGILDIFDRYNFTVKEDEPLEKEVAIDPEMLGKVFENLLEVKDRKSKGTYYTPREIVHYMCQQSLINYLATELKDKVEQKDIEILIKFGETTVEHDKNLAEKEKTEEAFKLPKDIIKNAQEIDDKLTDIRVCDPAVGSGAFLVGMMSEIVKARNALTNHLKNKQNRSLYNFKRQAIEKSLYGVDIDLGAVEIAKLRLWLSLIVDEEDIKNIKPLPNLDYKIVQGNSLLNVDKQNMFIDFNLKQIEQLKEKLFNETNVSKKREYKDQIDRLISEITENNKIFDYEIYFSEVFQNDDEKEKGFNVVIANPPYIGEKGHKEIFQEVKKYHLGNFYLGKMDYFYFFFHLALNLGKQNVSIAFITTNYYLTATGAKKLRKDFKERTAIKNLVNFNELKIFESALGQHNIVTILKKEVDENSIAKTCITQRLGTAKPELLLNIISGNDEKTNYDEVAQKDLYDGDEWYIRLSGLSDNEDPTTKLLNKIKQYGHLLSNICNVNTGLYTAADDIFILQNKKIKNIFSYLNNLEKILFKPLFKNSDIARYFTNIKNNKRVIYHYEKATYSLDEIPNIFSYLKRFEKRLKARKDNSLKGSLKRGRWDVMSLPKTAINFEGSKIIAPQRSPRNTFGYNEIPWYASADVYFVTQKDKKVFLKYLLALLNSKLYYLWLYHRGKRKGETLELYQKPLSEIPIKKINEDEQKPFVEIVDKILEITSAENYDPKNPPQEQKLLETKIDQMVYKLYGLTPEEIKIVENQK